MFKFWTRSHHDKDKTTPPKNKSIHSKLVDDKNDDMLSDNSETIVEEKISASTKTDETSHKSLLEQFLKPKHKKTDNEVIDNDEHKNHNIDKDESKDGFLFLNSPPSHRTSLGQRTLSNNQGRSSLQNNEIQETSQRSSTHSLFGLFKKNVPKDLAATDSDKDNISNNHPEVEKSRTDEIINRNICLLFLASLITDILYYIR